MFPLRDDRPTYTAPIVTPVLIALCVTVFLYEISVDEFTRNYLIGSFGVVASRFRPITFITSLFLHGGWSHIIGNMLFLWAFGKSMEDAMGHWKFLALYLACGILASFSQIAFNLGSHVPTIGASGAIAGVMGAYLLTFPRARIRTLIFFFFITITDIPAAFILIYWFVIQVFSGYGSIAHSQVSGGGVGWFAHIGGFLAGMLLVTLLGTRQRYFPRRDVHW